MSNQVAASGSDQSPIQTFVHGRDTNKFMKQPPVQAAAARLEQQLVQVPAPGPDQQPV